MSKQIPEKIRCLLCHSTFVITKQDLWGIHRLECLSDQCTNEVTIMTSGISKREPKMCYVGCVCEVCWPELNEV